MAVVDWNEEEEEEEEEINERISTQAKNYSSLLFIRENRDPVSLIPSFTQL